MDITLSPFRGSMDAQGEMNRLFEDMFGGLARRSERQGNYLTGWSPAVDVVRKDGNLIIVVEPPGIKPEDMQIKLEDNVLTISGERKAEREENGDGYHVRARRYGSFRRSITREKENETDRVRRALVQ